MLVSGCGCTDQLEEIKKAIAELKGDKGDNAPKPPKEKGELKKNRYMNVHVL